MSAWGASEQIGTAVLYEDDRIRLWEMDLAPGAETQLHTHVNDYVIVVIEGDRIAGVPGPGEDPARNSYTEADVHPGQYFVLKGGNTEIARNIGQRRYYELVIELKDPPP